MGERNASCEHAIVETKEPALPEPTTRPDRLAARRYKSRRWGSVSPKNNHMALCPVRLRLKLADDRVTYALAARHPRDCSSSRLLHQMQLTGHSQRRTSSEAVLSRKSASIVESRPT